MTFRSSYDLVVVGAGPVGLTAACLASRFGLKTLLVERESRPFPLPRAIHVNGDAVRVLQGVGLGNAIRPQLAIQRGMAVFGADGRLNANIPRPVDPDATGLSTQYAFYQPTLEAILRDSLAHDGLVDVRFACEATGFEQGHTGVYVSLSSAEGPTSCRSSFLVACDGAKSPTRTSLSIDMDDFGVADTWVVVDFFLDERSPLPDDVVHLHCEPSAPAVYVPGPGRHRRVEWMLRPGERADAFSQRTMVEERLSRWVDLDHVEIIRHATYQFRSLVAHRWREGRVFLAGDAAHLTPPFMGQGMGHGLRDVSNLIWKLAGASRGGSSDKLLDTYQSEREPHLRAIMDKVIEVGRMVSLSDADSAARRDQEMRDRGAQDGGGDPRARLGPGVSGVGPCAGIEFPQLRVIMDGVRSRLDDAVGLRPAILVLGHPSISAVEAIRRTPGLVWVGTSPLAQVRLDNDHRSPCPLRQWMGDVGCEALLLRPDKYVFDVSSLDGIVDMLSAYVSHVA